MTSSPRSTCTCLTLGFAPVATLNRGGKQGCTAILFQSSAISSSQPRGQNQRFQTVRNNRQLFRPCQNGMMFQVCSHRRRRVYLQSTRIRVVPCACYKKKRTPFLSHQIHSLKNRGGGDFVVAVVDVVVVTRGRKLFLAALLNSEICPLVLLVLFLIIIFCVCLPSFCRFYFYYYFLSLIVMRL